MALGLGESSAAELVVDTTRRFRGSGAVGAPALVAPDAPDEPDEAKDENANEDVRGRPPPEARVAVAASGLVTGVSPFCCGTGCTLFRTAADCTGDQATLEAAPTMVGELGELGDDGSFVADVLVAAGALPDRARNEGRRLVCEGDVGDVLGDKDEKDGRIFVGDCDDGVAAVSPGAPPPLKVGRLSSSADDDLDVVRAAVGTEGDAVDARLLAGDHPSVAEARRGRSTAVAHMRRRGTPKGPFGTLRLTRLS